jgi:hypothetical protein
MMRDRPPAVQVASAPEAEKELKTAANLHTLCADPGRRIYPWER